MEPGIKAALPRRCNLCLKRAPMTEDHLFPRGLALPGQRQVTRILRKVDPNFRGQRATFLAQNGVKKYTLCADCNNRVLGAELDPSLIEMHIAVSDALEKGRFPILPSVQVKGVNLGRVARAVAGHLLALDDKPEARHVMMRQLRRFVLQPETGLQQSLRFHLWLYPFNRQGILKDLFHTVFGSGHDPLWISAFKTYPLAFAFSTEVQDPSFRLQGVLDVTAAVETYDDRLFNITIPTRPLVDSNWPFAPHRDGAILTGDNGSVTTVPFKSSKRPRT